MNACVFFLISLIFTNSSAKKTLDKNETLNSANQNVESKNHNVTIIQIPHVNKTKTEPRRVPPEVVQKWAEKISLKLLDGENSFVRRKELKNGYTDVKIEERSGATIARKMARDLEELLLQRARAAENIARRAEQLVDSTPDPQVDYIYDRSVELDETKKREYPDSEWELPNWCRSLEQMTLDRSEHFDGNVSLYASSVYVAIEVFDCDPSVTKHLYWSEGLLPTFTDNYAQDATMEFQYFCSAKGFLRHYPAASWSSMYKLNMADAADVYDCRLRPWYVAASGAPRDILILLDASGSMDNSSNSVVASMFTLTLLSALTDDDQVNVLRFNLTVDSPISCFNETLVPANHVNSAAMIGTMEQYKYKNETNMEHVLTYAVKLLKRQQKIPGRPPACQQAIVLVTDTLYGDFPELLRKLDRQGNIRLFVLWLHDRYGLRDNTREYAEMISCNRDGYFAELTTHADVTEQVIRIMRVMERPLVSQRKERLRVFSDVYAHVEDPRRSEYYWTQKENAEQVYRYSLLRQNKAKLTNSESLNQYYLYQTSLDKYGTYYEGEDINYRLQISVSIPVFESTTFENITIKLNEEKQRNSTRTYPVNRLLGVAGVDIPIDHLRLILPYHQLGAGGSLFLLDHRGNIVLHDNLKPVFDGDILKPGYRTMDFSDIEQAGVIHEPRRYPKEWRELRKALVLDQSKGNRTILAKYIFEGGMRVLMDDREYYWQRVLDHYTAVVVVPAGYGRRHAVYDRTFSQKLASAGFAALSRTEYAVNQEWLYCRYIEPSFTTREDEVRHFIMRRKDEPYFRMRKTDRYFSHNNINPSRLDKPYLCNEELMAWLCKDAIATVNWAEKQSSETHTNCSACELGPVTAFFASESGLTRWQQYRATSSHADPPEGSAWPGGPTENWYRRAVAAPGLLIVHAPVTPYRRLRTTYASVPPVGVRAEWLTAARVLDHEKGVIVGVAGYHFHPQHFADVIKVITNFSCPKEDKCEPKCDGEIWACVIIDDGGWIVSGDDYQRESHGDPVRRHLAGVHPAAMAALLTAKIFQINWIHDYQGVCFEAGGSSIMISSLLKTLWCSTILLFRISREIGTICAVISTSTLVSAETKEEKEKRTKNLRLHNDREKFDTLFDSRVLINRTKFAACDRSRPFYEFQNTKEAIEALKMPVVPCKWPLVGAPIPGTNLLLLAIYKRCGYTGKPVPDPLGNEPVDIVALSKSMKMKVNVSWSELHPASRLACWRSLEPLPGRPPHTRCFPHNYTEEEGYRQCGPWLPDPEVEENSGHILWTTMTNSHLSLFVIFIVYFYLLF